MFPSIEEAAGEKGLMDANVEQHKAFSEGLEAMKTYLHSQPDPPTSQTFSASRLREIIDSFAPKLRQHLADEIPTLLALSKYEDKIPINKIFRRGKASVDGLARIPFFFLNLDETFEDGLWKNWPPAPAPVKWIARNGLTVWNKGYWKFAACDGAGRPKELYSYESEEGK